MRRKKMHDENVQTVNSLSEYIDIIIQISLGRKSDLSHEDTLFFRGVEDKDYQVIPSISIKPIEHIHNSLLWFENNIVNEAQRKRPDIFFEDEYPINLLTKLQHYGIPTRLLDITTSGLSALFFACQNNTVDGEVLVFRINRYDIHSNSSAIVNTIAMSYKLGVYSFKELISRAEDSNFFKGFKYKHVKNRFEDHKTYLEELEKNYFKQPIFVLPQELSERQKRQQGAFIIFPNGGVGNDEILPLEKNNPIINTRIIIKGTQKKEILDQLSLFGITREFLFPDNIDILCESIKENALRLFRSSAKGIDK